MAIRFAGKRALVTGAGKGIGRGLTLKLAEAGAEVVAVSRTQSDLDSLKKENSKIQTLFLDVGNWANTQDALRRVGRIDLLVNSAGVYTVKEFGGFSEDEVDNVMNINVKAIVNVSQMVVNEMKACGKGGAIVNISSIASIRARPLCTIHCASKGAVDQLTRGMAVELGPHKIRVNSVNPTVVRTRMAEEAGMFDPKNASANQMLDRTPLKRFAEVSDIVDPVLFLLSDQAAMITGAIIPIDGGLGINCA